MSWLFPQAFWLLLLPAAALLRRWRKGNSLKGRDVWLLLALLLVAAAIARPVVEREPVEIETAQSDVIVAVDLSQSMQASDLAPSRLEAAKSLLAEVVRSNPDVRFGVIGFTTNAIILSPLTADSELLLHLFGALDESMVMTRGTRLEGVLQLARKMSHAKRPKLFILTDGGDELSYPDEAVFARTSGLQVNIVMLATRSGSTLGDAAGGLLKDAKGQIVVSSRNDAVTQISEASGGEVIEGPDAARVSKVIAAQAETDARNKTRVLLYHEYFYFCIVGAMVAFMIGITGLHARLARRAAALLLLVGVGAQGGMLDAYYLHAARSAYEQGDYARAAEAYAQVEGDRARYNAASSYYRAGESQKALELYSTLHSTDPAFMATVYFNIANCYIRLKEFAAARGALQKVLALTPDPQAYDNLYAISRAEEQDHMLTGRQEGKKRPESAQSESEAQPPRGSKESGGGSNMDVSAAASGASASAGKKAQGDPRLDFSQSKGMLSSRQYELINQRSVNETKPW